MVLRVLFTRYGAVTDFALGNTLNRCSANLRRLLIVFDQFGEPTIGKQLEGDFRDKQLPRLYMEVITQCVNRSGGGIYFEGPFDIKQGGKCSLRTSGFVGELGLGQAMVRHEGAEVPGYY